MAKGDMPRGRIGSSAKRAEPPETEPVKRTEPAKKAEPDKKVDPGETNSEPPSSEPVRTGTVSLPKGADEVRLRLAQEGIDTTGKDDEAVIAEDRAQQPVRTNRALDDLIRDRTGKDPDTLSDDEKKQVVRNEVLDQSGVTAKLTEGRRVIGAKDPHDKTDEEIAEDLEEIGRREFIAETVGKRSGELTPEDFADFERLRDRAAVEAETGKDFEDLSPMDLAQARQTIRDRVVDSHLDPGGGGGSSDPGSVPGFGGHSGRSGSAPGDLAGTSSGSSGGSTQGSGRDGSSDSGSGSGSDSGSGDSGTGESTGVRGTDPFDGVDSGSGGGTDPDHGSGTGAGGAGAGGSGQGSGADQGGTGAGAGQGGSGQGDAGDGNAQGDTGTTGSSEPDGEPMDLRPVDVHNSDGSTERGYITPDGTIVDENGNEIPADVYDSYSTVIPSGEPEDDDGGDGSDGDGDDDDDDGDDDDGDDGDAGAGGGVGFTPDPDEPTGGSGLLPGFNRGIRPGGLPTDPPDTETQPVEEGAGGYVAPGAAEPRRVPGVDQPDPDSTGRPPSGWRPPNEIPNHDGGVIDPVDDMAFGTGDANRGAATHQQASSAGGGSGASAVPEHANVDDQPASASAGTSAGEAPDQDDGLGMSGTLDDQSDDADDGDSFDLDD